MNDIVAIVVTYNRKDLLCENIECLLGQSAGALDILVIDNNSTDGTREMLDWFIKASQIIYINTGKNLGGAGGFQFGIREAAMRGYKYLWIMDDDCMPKPNALEKLLDADAKLNGNYGFLSSKELWIDGSINKVQKHPLTRFIKDYSPELVPATLASFVSLFIKSDMVREFGLPIKEFFIWTDDWEFTRRISKKYPCYVATQSEVVHKKKTRTSSDISTDSMERIDRYKLLYRNDVYFYRKEGLTGFFYEVVRLSGHMLRVLVRAKDHKWLRIKTIFTGTADGFKFHPEIEYLDQVRSDT